MSFNRLSKSWIQGILFNYKMNHYVSHTIDKIKLTLRLYILWFIQIITNEHDPSTLTLDSYTTYILAVPFLFYLFTLVCVLCIWNLFVLRLYDIVVLNINNKNTTRRTIGYYIGKTCYEICVYCGCVFIKFAQTFCTQLQYDAQNNIEKQQMYEHIKKLYSDVPPMTAEEMDYVKQHHTPQQLRTSLKAINYNAIKCGSVATVHYGKLNDDTPVAIKILRLHIHELALASIKCLYWIHGMYNCVRRIFISINIPAFKSLHHFILFVDSFQIHDTLRKFTPAILQQLSFKNEIYNLQYFEEKTQYAFKRLKTPHVYPEYSNDKMLVMNWIDGTPLHDLTQEQLETIRLPRNNDLKHEILLFVATSVYNEDWEMFHCDFQPGNQMYDEKTETIWVIDFGLTGNMTREQKFVEKQFFLHLCKREFDLAADWMLKHLFEHRKLGSMVNHQFPADLLEKVVDIIERTLGADLVDYQTFCMELVPLLYDTYDLSPSPCFTLFEMALITSDSTMKLLFTNSNIWKLFLQLAIELKWIPDPNLSVEEKQMLELQNDLLSSL